MRDVKTHLLKRKRLINSHLPSFLPKSGKFTKLLYNAAKYSLMSGGKRVRPILTLAACEAVSGKYMKALPVACAIEMIHTYTLIHDDLPAMDNDNFRRGKPTCHKAFGEDTAILAGDLLNALAFQIIAENYKEKAFLLIGELSKFLGINGVVGGQIADLKASSRNIGVEELNFITRHKTADLFVAAVMCGGIVGGANKKELEGLAAYAGHIGLAFQIIDDILDYAKKEKNSYPAVIGLKRSRIDANNELNSALAALPRTKNYATLKEIGLFLANRKV